ncbi:hypothetical protein [Streptomyces sp. NPDC127084]|uniref:hypothetical protein n=1 Tax=Streptomyces sp. NPDC127084 TaxID=3347133 RepID=UPI00365CD983
MTPFAGGVVSELGPFAGGVAGSVAPLVGTLADQVKPVAHGVGGSTGSFAGGVAGESRPFAQDLTGTVAATPVASHAVFGAQDAATAITPSYADGATQHVARHATERVIHGS